MKKKTLILKDVESGNEFLFEDKVFLIEDAFLIDNLEKPSIRNSESKIVIKTLNDTHVSDVIQIKVSMNETGTFLISFAKDGLDYEKRKSLLQEISGLKSNAVQTNSTQLKKTKNLVAILNKYKPIYATFVNDGEYTVNITKLSLEEFKFPLLVLHKSQQKTVVTQAPVVKTKEGKSKPKYQRFSIFTVDYLFVLLFAALCAFGAFTALFEFKNEENIAIFLLVLSVAFACVLVLSVQSTLYKKGKIINPWLRYYLIIFILLGVVGGTVAGYYVSKMVLKTEIENFDYKKVILMAGGISAAVCLATLTLSRLVNLITKKKYE